MNFIFDLQRFDAQIISSGENITLDGVTYTALDGDATLNLDDDGKVSGLASGKVSAIVSGAENSPTVTFDATDSAVTFTATSDGKVISITPFPIEFISGEFTYKSGRIDITAGSDMAIVTQRGDFILRNENHFVTDSAYIFTSTSLTSESEHVISKFSMTNGTDVRELNLEQLGTVINSFTERGFTLVEGSSEVLNIGDYKLTATATNGDAGLNVELGESGLVFVPNTGDGKLTVALTRDNMTIFSGELECTSGSITLGYDHAVTFAKDTSFKFTTPNNSVLTVTATDEATTAIALTDTGITFTPNTGDGALNITYSKQGNQVFEGSLNITNGTITFDATEKRFTISDGTKVTLGIFGLEMEVEVVGDTTVGSGIGANFKIDADENGNLIFTPDENGGSFNIALKRESQTLLQNSLMLTASATDDDDLETFFENNVTVNGPIMFNPQTGLLTLLDGTEISLEFNNYTLTATADGDASSTLSLTEEGISITPQQGDGTLKLTLGSAQGSMSVGFEVLSGGFVFGENGALNVVEGTELQLKFSDDYSVKFKTTDAAGGALSLGADGLTFTPNTEDGGLELSVTRNGETRTASLDVTGSLTYKLDGSISLAEGTVVKNVFEDGNILTITANTDASGSIVFNPQNGLTITPSTADALTVALTTGELEVAKFSSITGSINYSGGLVTASDGTQANLLIYDTWESKLSTSGGTASLEFTADRTVYTANEGATFVLDYLDGSTVEIQNGSFSDIYATETEDAIELISEGSTFRANDDEFVFTLEKAGNYTLNGISVTTTTDNVQVVLSDYNTVEFSEDTQTNLATSISGNDLNVTASVSEGQGSVTVDDDGNITYDATGGTLQVKVPLEDVIGDSLLPSDFTISGGSITMGATNADATKNISITAGTALSFTKNGMTFDTVIQNDINGRLWMRNGTVIYLHSYEEANFDTTITFADKEIFNGMITLGGAFAYNAATGTTGPVDSNTYDVRDSYIQIALGTQSLRLTTNGDTFFAVLDVDDDGKITFDFNNENYNSMLLKVSTGDTDVLNSALTVKGTIVIDPATQELSLLKDTVLTLSQNDNDLQITALDDAGGKLTVTDDGVRFAPNENDGALELNFVAANRKADLNITGAIIFGNDGKISLEDGTEINLAWEDGNSLKLTSSGSTGSIAFDDKGLKITSDDENLNMTFTTPSASTDISGIKGTIHYNAGNVLFDENSKITATSTLGGQPIFTTLEAIDGTGYISFNTTNGVIYSADTGALKVTWSRDDLESTFTVNSGSVQLGHNLFLITEGSDIATDLKDFVPAFYFTTSEAGNYTINGQTITTSAEGLALTATDDYMAFKTSSDVVEYEGMTFAGNGNVSLKPGNVVLGAGVEATGFDEDKSFVLAEAGNVTADAKVFELTELETPIEIPMEITVTGAQDGFTFSRTLTKESEAYLDDALNEEDFENYTSPYIGKVFSEKFIAAGDSSYRIRTDAIGLEDVIGISNDATITGGASLADEPTLSYYKLITDTEGSFTIGEKTYNVSGDSSVAITARFEADKAPYASAFDSLNGTVSGDFTGGAFKINGSSGLQVLGDTDVSIVADDSGFEILGLDTGASLQVSAADTYTVNGTEIAAGASTVIVGTEDGKAQEMSSKSDIEILAETILKRTAAGYPAMAAAVFDPEGNYGDEPTNYVDKEDWTITSADNLQLHAVHYTPEDSNDKWVVLIHGYGNNHTAMYTYAASYLANGYNVLMIDQRAAGESEGTWLTMGAAESADVALWTQEIASRNSNAKITLHGVSMGAATAMLAAARSDATNITSIVEDCGYSNVLETFSTIITNTPELGISPEVVPYLDPVAASLTGYYLHAAAPIDSISSVKMPSLFISGDADSVAPVSMLDELYAASGAEVKEKFIVEGTAHALAVFDDSIGYNNAVFRFIAEADEEGWVTTNTTDGISLRGTKYDDSIANSGSNVTINGGAGNDQISLSSNSEDNVIQYSVGDGDDTIWGLNADDKLQIGDGTATYSTQTSGEDVIVRVSDGSIILKDARNKPKPIIIGESGSSGGSGGSGGSIDIDDFDEEEIVTITGGGKQDIDLSKEDYEVAYIEADALGNKNVTLGGDNTVVVEDTNAKVNITASKGNDTIISNGEKVFVSLRGGKTDIFATGGKMTVSGYNPATGSGFHTDYEDIFAAIDEDAIDFDRGKITIDSAVVDFDTDSLLINLFNADGDLQKVGNAPQDGSLNVSKEKADMILVADENSTITGGSGNDSIYAFEGSHVDGGAGRNYIEMETRDESAEGVTIALSGGKNTIANFKDGFDYESDKLFLGVKDTVDFKFNGTDLKVKVNNNLRGVVSNIADGADFVNVLTADANSSVKVVAAQKGAIITVDDELADFYTGKKSGVDFTNYEETLMVNLGSEETSLGTGEVLFSGINQITVGSGLNTLIGSSANETLTGNADGITEFGFGAGGGRDVIQNFNFDEDKINVSGAVTDVRIIGEGNVRLQVGSGSDYLTIEDAQGKNFNINGFTAKVDKNIDFDNTANYFVATASNATLTVGDSVAGDAIIWLDNPDRNSSVFKGDIKTLDASNATVKTELAGNVLNNTILAGSGDTSLWGGNGGNDLLIGGTGKNMFFYALSNGNDTVSNTNDGDIVYLSGVTLENIIGADFTDSAVAINFSDGGQLTVNEGGKAVDFVVGEQTFRVNDEHNGFTIKS